MFPVAEDAWHTFWRAYRQGLRAPAREDAAGRSMRCLVTGELSTPAATHPKVTGLAGVGGFSGGDALISFDKDAFTSYGLSQGENAAVSEDGAAVYRAALNALLSQERHRQRLNNLMIVHWFDREVSKEDDPLAWLEHPEHRGNQAQLRARDSLRAVNRVHRPQSLVGDLYHAFALSGMAGRIMVRDYLYGNFAELVTQVERWFTDLRIVDHRTGQLATEPKFLAVQATLVRDLNDLPPPWAARLWRVAVKGEDLPVPVLAQALSRFRVDLLRDGSMSPARMGLIKAFFCRRKIHVREELDETSQVPAYRCGRLLAVLARLQEVAIPGVKAGVVQRFYPAASATPALVLGRLLRTAQFHLGKLDRGPASYHESRIADVIDGMRELPALLSLKDQSLFALGYYQQIAADSKDRQKRQNSHARETQNVG